MKRKTLDPGLRRDDSFGVDNSLSLTLIRYKEIGMKNSSNVIPAQAGIQRLSVFY
jgi:hypothetical protein